MRRIIKVNESQLRETEGEAFKYLDTTDDTKPYNGQSATTAQGKLNGEEDGCPALGDRLANMRTPQAWSRYRMYGNIQTPAHADSFSNFDDLEDNDFLDEGVMAGADQDNDGVPDDIERICDMGGLDILSDGDNSNNGMVIPKGVDIKLNQLNAIIANLPPKKKAMVINNILETNDISSIPYSWKKYLVYKLMSNKDNPNLTPNKQ